MTFKDRLEDYTESEFREFLDTLFTNPENLKGKKFGDHVDRFVRHFKVITEHPAGSDLIFYPKEGCDESVECILKQVKEWRAQNGKPGFKPDDE